MTLSKNKMNIMVFGAGSSTQGVLHALKAHAANVSTYLTRESCGYSPALEGQTFSAREYPNPCEILEKTKVDLVIPMSIDWILADWTEEFLALEIPILSPTGAGVRLERDRDFARELCEKHHIPFPKSFVAQNRLQAEAILENHPGAYVIKNPLCSPSSPVHTIMSETVEDTRSWLKLVNYEEGIFMQEYMGRREAGHIAFITGGEIYSLISNQEYKRAFDGNMGIIAGAPLGGIVEKDPQDKYGVAQELLHPLLPWFREVGYHGPVQVTGIRKDDRWVVLEYNVRIGVTCGPIILQMLQDPLQILWDTVHNRKTTIRFKENLMFGCSLTLAGYGYPYSQIAGPSFPVRVSGPLDCHVWWNEVFSDKEGKLFTNGQRIADLVAIEATLEQAVQRVYDNVSRVRCTSSYYRTDIGQSLWPPGKE